VTPDNVNPSLAHGLTRQSHHARGLQYTGHRYAPGVGSIFKRMHPTPGPPSGGPSRPLTSWAGQRGMSTEPPLHPAPVPEFLKPGELMCRDTIRRGPGQLFSPIKHAIQLPSAAGLLDGTPRYTAVELLNPPYRKTPQNKNCAGKINGGERMTAQYGVRHQHGLTSNSATQSSMHRSPSMLPTTLCSTIWEIKEGRESAPPSFSMLNIGERFREGINGYEGSTLHQRRSDLASPQSHRYQRPLTSWAGDRYMPRVTRYANIGS